MMRRNVICELLEPFMELPQTMRSDVKDEDLAMNWAVSCEVTIGQPDTPGEWPAGMYIDLFVGHYQTVIERLRLAVNTHPPE